MYFDINTKYYKDLTIKINGVKTIISDNINTYINSISNYIRSSKKYNVTVNAHPFFGNMYLSNAKYKDNIVAFWMHHNYAAFANINYGQNIESDTIVKNIIDIIYETFKVFVRPTGEAIGKLSNKSINTIKTNICTNLKNSTYGFPPPIIYEVIDTKIIPEFIKACDEYLYDDDEAIEASKPILKEAINKLKSRQNIVIYISSAHCNSAAKHDASGRSIEYLWSRLCGDLLQATLVKLGFTAIKVFPESVNITSKPGSNGELELKCRGMRAHIINNYLIKTCGIKNITPIGIALHTNGLDGLASGGTVITLEDLDMCDILSGCIFNKFKYYKFSIDYGKRTITLNYINDDNSISSNAFRAGEQGIDELTYLIKSDDYDKIYTFTTILSESLFHDNTSDIEKLWSKEGNKNIILAHVMGIYDFLARKISIKNTNIKNYTFVENLKLPKDDTSVKNLEKEAASIIDNIHIVQFKNLEKECIYGGSEIVINGKTYNSIDYKEKNDLITKYMTDTNKINDGIIKEIISAYPHFEKTFNSGITIGSELVYKVTKSTKDNLTYTITSKYNSKIANTLSASDNINSSISYMKNNLYNAVIF